MRKIEELETMVGVLSTSVEDHKAAFDDKTRGDIGTLKDSIDGDLASTVKTRDDVAVARTGRDDAELNHLREYILTDPSR